MQMKPPEDYHTTTLDGAEGFARYHAEPEDTGFDEGYDEPTKQYIYSCGTCGYEFESKDDNESFCHNCDDIHIEIVEVHSN